MLILENISKSYAGRGKVLDELNLHIEKGESLAVTGPSGSGKSTLLNIAGLMDRPDSGKIKFQGNSILGYDSSEAAEYRNRNIGFVFQDHLLLNHLTVKENIMLPLLASPLSDDDYGIKEKYVDILLDKIRITNLKDKFPFQISGGEAQRVTLVRALVNRPSLLLADEPTGSLDQINANLLGRLLREINEEYGIALLVVTHSEDLASMMRNHLRLSEGKLV